MVSGSESGESGVKGKGGEEFHLTLAYLPETLTDS